MRVLRIVGSEALWLVNILAAAAFVAIGLAKFPRRRPAPALQPHLCG